MKSIIFVSLLIISCLSFNIKTQIEADDRVKVDFYYQSLCPYCQQFMGRALKQASQTQDFWKICNFNLYPYGNAKRVQNGGSWTFTCQHGARQCQGNFIQTCAIKKNDLYTKALPFIICLQSGSQDWISTGKRCASTHGLNWDQINTCATSAEGVNYMVQMAQATQALVPAHQYVPWVVINDQHTQSSQTAIQQNMVKYVCSIYKGPLKISACGN